MLLEDEASGRQANLCLRIPVHPHRTGGSGHNAVLKCVAVATKMLVECLNGKQIALWVSPVFSALLLMQGIYRKRLFNRPSTPHRKILS